MAIILANRQHVRDQMPKKSTDAHAESQPSKILTTVSRDVRGLAQLVSSEVLTIVGISISTAEATEAWPT